MNVEEAISKACADVGILPPKDRALGRWLKTNTLSGRNGAGDGRVMISDAKVTGFNWQTGETVTVWMKDISSPVVRRQMRADIEKQERERQKRANRAADTAAALIKASSLQLHSYLAGKGFPEEKVLVVGADAVAKAGGPFLIPEGAQSAIVIPCRAGGAVKSVQLIWENGRKKFLFGGETGGTSHRIATGRDCWLSEGFATGLSLRKAFRAIQYQATILCCFSASNVETVARHAQGKTFIAADNDKPIEQYGGLGAGEYYARRSGVPFVMPTAVGDDFNDLHQRDGIFAVQRLILDFMKGTRK